MFPVLTVNSVRTDWLCEVGVFRQSGVRACVPACVCVCVCVCVLSDDHTVMLFVLFLSFYII